MKVAIAYSTKDRVGLTKQTLPALNSGTDGHVHWFDGSATPEGLAFFEEHQFPAVHRHAAVKGGADAAIVCALTTLLEHPMDFDVIGLCENDVLLHEGWFEATMQLFKKGEDEGLAVGAVSPRCYEDRILIQRDAYAVCHNLGAGIVLLTRQAARLLLDNYRTGWWHDSRAIFAQLCGIDIGRYGAFRGNEQWTTADWHFDAVLAQHGLASLALTPSMCDMIGQEPSLEEQGLKLATGQVMERWDNKAFESFKLLAKAIRDNSWCPLAVPAIHRYANVHTIFAHQLVEANYFGDWRLKWSQGFGPFAWRSNASDCKLPVLLFGPVTFLVSGGKHGAKVVITDTESGYEITPDIPAGEMQIAQLQVPGGMSYREIVLTCSTGAVFYGVQTTEPQPVTNTKFDYHSLPPV